MKRVIITLMLITVIAISAGLAYADGSGWGTGSWQTMSGILSGLDGGSITSNYGSNWVRAIHPVNTNSAGAFTATFKFTVNNLSSDVFVGVANGISDSNDLLVGYSKDNNAFIVTQNQQSVMANLGSSVSPNTQYTATITSKDGKKFDISIAGAGSTTVDGFVPTYVTLTINNQGAAKGPSVDSVTYTSDPVGASPSPSPSPSPGTNATGSVTQNDPYNYADMQNWYATQYVPPVLSNQSVVYDQSGKIVKVITGKPGAATVMPISGAAVTATAAPTTVPTSTVTASANVTKTTTATTTATSTPIATVAPTKSQSPGFGIILAAIGMLGAIFLVSRKK